MWVCLCRERLRRGSSFDGCLASFDGLLDVLGSQTKALTSFWVGRGRLGPVSVAQALEVALMRQAMGLPGGSSGRLSTCFFEGLAIRSSRNVENEVSHEVSGPPVHSDWLPNMRDRRVNAHAIGVPRQELGPNDDPSWPLGAR